MPIWGRCGFESRNGEQFFLRSSMVERRAVNADVPCSSQGARVGRVGERFIPAVLKTARSKGLVSSNLTSSKKYKGERVKKSPVNLCPACPNGLIVKKKCAECGTSFAPYRRQDRVKARKIALPTHKERYRIRKLIPGTGMQSMTINNK